MQTDPTTLYLPFHLADKGFHFARLLANDTRFNWATGFQLKEKFALRSHEKDFALRLLNQRRNLWLFRTNQRHSCGDFAAVDMSAADPDERRVYVMELKLGAPLVAAPQLGNIQLAGYHQAIQEIATTTRIITTGSPVELVFGDNTRVLNHLGAK